MSDGGGRFFLGFGVAGGAAAGIPECFTATPASTWLIGCSLTNALRLSIPLCAKVRIPIGVVVLFCLLPLGFWTFFLGSGLSGGDLSVSVSVSVSASPGDGPASRGGFPYLAARLALDTFSIPSATQVALSFRRYEKSCLLNCAKENSFVNTSSGKRPINCSWKSDRSPAVQIASCRSPTTKVN
jgi:hypothetical protein